MAKEPNDGNRQRKTISPYDIITLDNSDHLIMQVQLKGHSTEKMTSKQVLWIIDTGASNHMTGNLSDLHNLRAISPCPVGLPYGSNIVATKEGSIIFGSDFVLENVLYMSRLSCNLISVTTYRSFQLYYPIYS